MRHSFAFLLLTLGLVAADRPVIKVAVYDDKGATGKGIPSVEAILGQTADIKLTRLKGADIANGGLQGYDLVMFTGGSGSAEAAGLGEKGREEVRDFVRHGGGYVGICAGAYLVGKKCAAIMQNGGVFNSNNAIVSTLLQYQIPVLLLIYYAGDIGDRTFGTTGAMTEPVLQALGIRYYIMRDIDDAPELIKRAQILAEDSKKPIALLMTKELLGRRSALKSL